MVYGHEELYENMEKTTSRVGSLGKAAVKGARRKKPLNAKNYADSVLEMAMKKVRMGGRNE